MAQARSIKFGEMFILIRDPDDSGGAFEAPCGFESLTMTVNVETNTTNLPDCDDPDLPGWLASDVVSQQMTLEGEGVLDKAAMQKWQEWYFNNGGQEWDVRFFRDLSAVDGGGYFQGPAIISAYSEQGQRGQRWRNSVTITFNGKPTWTPAAP